MPLELQIAKQLPDFALDVSFRAEDDAPLAILGPSGAGKTMLLRCIAGLERPDRGRIALDGRLLFDSQRGIDVPARSRRVGLLFQQFALFPHRTVAENLAFGLRHLPAGERNSRMAAVARQTHIAGLDHRYPRELSGGEQQRVALARALAIDPEALMLDEPLSSLDTHLRSQIESQLQQTFSEYRRPSILVTHSMEEAYRLCRRLVVLSRGRVAAFGDMEGIFRHPPNTEVARLTGCKNISRANPAANGLIEAVDWGCLLRVTESVEAAGDGRVRVADPTLPAAEKVGSHGEKGFLGGLDTTTDRVSSTAGQRLLGGRSFSSDITPPRSGVLTPEAPTPSPSRESFAFAAPAYVGIRAHHIDFVEPSASGAFPENVFPCWLVRSSETPFRITLFLSLHEPGKCAAVDSVAPAWPESNRGASREPLGSVAESRVVAASSRRRFSGSSAGADDDFDLQAEVFKEKWERFRNTPQPWRAHLPPSALFLMPE
ncbi:MAG TPA: ATP-binding cassette domain-containing protein [Candidatus Acidoferrum sp.]|nr:ATP-binding cassette domain-containing protein [Candidatus Acidoferrum sp.]